MANKEEFDISLVRDYPKSNRRVGIEVERYRIGNREIAETAKIEAVHVSPYGLEFVGQHNYEVGTLLKIHINIPDFWERKSRYVNYNRIDSPSNIKVLGKVVISEEAGRRIKKRSIVVETVNIDEIDERVLIEFLRNE